MPIGWEDLRDRVRLMAEEIENADFTVMTSGERERLARVVENTSHLAQTLIIRAEIGGDHWWQPPTPPTSR